jgi:hypothetical protein
VTSSADVARVRDALLDAVRWGGQPDTEVLDAACDALYARRGTAR